MLALAFLLLIGVSLVADGLGFHIEKGYIYAAMGFSVLVEGVNIFAKQRKANRGGAKHHTTAGNVIREQVAAHAPSAAAPVAATPAPATVKQKPKGTASSRSQSRPKSAPRKKS